MIEVPCYIDNAFKNKYKSIISNVESSERKGTDALQALHRIASLSQHPFLIEGQPFRENIDEYVKASSKLAQMLVLLEEIKNKNEKVLIFTRSRVMQDILKSVIYSKLGIDVSIVNGETVSKHKYVNKTRSGIIAEFSSKAGFNILILSPEVAGVGLTITAANHVIHYGRWWNPAKENQATDRAYRIGQEKEVNVYHLLLKDKDGEIETFDEKLHRLLKSREELADNFFIANGDETDIQKGLISDMFKAENAQKSNDHIEPLKHDLRRYNPFQFEALITLLFKHRFEGGEIFVTCKNGDRGIDVIGIKPTEILMIQVKMTNSDGFCSKDAITETIDGLDFYRNSMFTKEMKNTQVKLAVVTSGKFDKDFRREAKNKDIEIYDFNAINSLYNESKISSFDVEELDRNRPKSIEGVKSIIHASSQKVYKKS